MSNNRHGVKHWKKFMAPISHSYGDGSSCPGFHKTHSFPGCTLGPSVSNTTEELRSRSHHSSSPRQLHELIADQRLTLPPHSLHSAERKYCGAASTVVSLAGHLPETCPSRLASPHQLLLRRVVRLFVSSCFIITSENAQRLY